jgi:hypothetical protein
MGSEHLRGGELGGYPVVAHRALPVGFEVAFGQEGLARSGLDRRRAEGSG